MKFNQLLTILFVGGLFASCAKDRTCSCEFPDAPESDFVTTYPASDCNGDCMEAAEAACDAADTAAQLINGSCTWE